MEVWERFGEMVPDPDGEPFSGWVFQAFDFIQQVVVEPFYQRIDRASQIGKVDDPAESRIEGAAYRDGAAERVTMDASALVPLCDVRKKVCSLESEVLDELYDFAHSSSLIRLARRCRPTAFCPHGSPEGHSKVD
jgi:hypothetical protein